MSVADAFDLDALDVEDERREPFVFTYKGETFELPVAASMQWQQQIKLAELGQLDSLRLIMGEEQFARFESLPMTAGRLGKLIERWLAYQGIKPGE